LLGRSTDGVSACDLPPSEVNGKVLMLRSIKDSGISAQGGISGCKLGVAPSICDGRWLALGWLIGRPHSLPFFIGIIDFGFQFLEVLEDTVNALRK
jgi:hypothetical protein